MGTVVSFNSTKGFGHIKRDRDEKVFFVGFKNVRGNKGEYCSLSEDDKVIFSIKQDEKNGQVADDIVVFDPVKETEARLAVLLGLFKPPGARSQLQQSFSKDPIFDQKLVPMVFEFAGISPKK